MLARGAKPKLTLSVATASAQASRPSLSLMTPLTPLRSPLSPRLPVPNSPTALNTKLNQRGFATGQQPTYAYANHSTSRSILKKSQHHHNQSSRSSSSSPSSSASASASTSATGRQLQFSDKPMIHCVTPIEEEDYYGTYRKMTRDERRWQSRP